MANITCPWTQKSPSTRCYIYSDYTDTLNAKSVPIVPTDCPIASAYQYHHPHAKAISVFIYFFLDFTKCICPDTTHLFRLHASDQSLLWMSECLTIELDSSRLSPFSWNQNNDFISYHWIFSCTHHDSTENRVGSAELTVICQTSPFTLHTHLEWALIVLYSMDSMICFAINTLTYDIIDVKTNRIFCYPNSFLNETRPCIQ